jgi:hypothetical protein
MQMIFLGLDLVVVLLSVEVHEVKFIDHAETFQQLKRPVHSRAIDVWIALSRETQQTRRI